MDLLLKTFCRLLLFVAVLIGGLQLPPLHGQSTSWTVRNGTDYHDPSNWNNGVPANDMFVIFDLSEMQLIEVNSLAVIEDGSISNGDYRFTGAGPLQLFDTLTIDFGANVTFDNILFEDVGVFIGRGIVIGGDQSGSVSVINSSNVVTRGVSIGAATDSSLVIDGPEAEWTTFGLISRGGSSQTSFIEVKNSGTLTASLSSLDGLITVSGSGASFESGSTNLGVLDSGSIEVLDGALFTNDSSVDIGSQPNSVGTVLVSGSGSTWTNLGDYIEVGDDPDGEGYVIIENGGTLTGDDLWTFGRLSAITVNGPESSIEMVRGVAINAQGMSMLNIENGATVTSQYGFVGSTNGTSIATVTGADSEWTVTFETRIGSQRTGVLSILDGGSVFSLGVLSTTVGNAGGGNGSVQVFGAGSTWVIDSNLRIADFGGAGFVEVDQGGEIIQTSGSTWLDLEGDFILGETGSLSIPSFYVVGTLDLSGNHQLFPTILQVWSSDSLVRTNPNSTSTFSGEVVNNGQINTEASSHTIIEGKLSGTGSFTGDGDVSLHSDLSPGYFAAGTLNFSGALSLSPQTQTIVKLGGTEDNEFDRIIALGNLSLDGELVVSTIDGYTPQDGTAYLIAEIDGTRTGEFSGLAEGDFVATFNGVSLYISYVAGDGNDIALTTPDAFGPDILLVTRGNLASGTAEDLLLSDNVDVSIRRNQTDIQSRTEFELATTSPVDEASIFEVRMEASVFARSPVTQTIELFDYDAGTWAVVDSSLANQMNDLIVVAAPAGDTSRFIEDGTRAVRARIRFQSQNPRQQFSSNVDQFVWIIAE